MQSVRCGVLLPMCRCSMSCAKTAESIEISFRVRTRGGRRKEPCSRWKPGSARGSGSVGDANQSYSVGGSSDLAFRCQDYNN